MSWINRLFHSDTIEHEDEELKNEIKSLKKERDKLTSDISQLKHEHKMGDEDIKHMVRIRQEQLDIEHEKKILYLVTEKAEAISAIREEYRDKIEQHLSSETDRLKDMYGEVLKRLPDISVKLKGEV